jgi:hypothetical protein
MTTLYVISVILYYDSWSRQGDSFGLFGTERQSVLMPRAVGYIRCIIDDHLNHWNHSINLNHLISFS